LATFLYGISPADPATLVAVTAALVGVSLFACYLPTRRATSIDPVRVLRM